MRILERADSLLINARIRWNRFWDEERGDTNFISILVLLGIALALAGVFLGFKDQVLGWVDENIGTFFSQKGGR